MADERPAIQVFSVSPTPWAIRCRAHGQVFLTAAEYERQMHRPNASWKCPKCGRHADWDDDNYEKYHDAPR